MKVTVEVSSAQILALAQLAGEVRASLDRDAPPPVAQIRYELACSVVDALAFAAQGEQMKAAGIEVDSWAITQVGISSDEELQCAVRLAEAHIAGGTSPPLRGDTTARIARGLIAMAGRLRGATLPAKLSTTPFKAPAASHPEPEAVLRFGDIEVRLTLTYLHHLRNCQGWGDRSINNLYCDADLEMAQAMEMIERAMWKETDHG